MAAGRLQRLVRFHYTGFVWGRSGEIRGDVLTDRTQISQASIQWLVGQGFEARSCGLHPPFYPSSPLDQCQRPSSPGQSLEHRLKVNSGIISTATPGGIARQWACQWRSLLDLARKLPPSPGP